VGIGIELSQQEMNCTNHEESSRKSKQVQSLQLSVCAQLKRATSPTPVAAAGCVLALAFTTHPLLPPSFFIFYLIINRFTSLPAEEDYKSTATGACFRLRLPSIDAGCCWSQRVAQGLEKKMQQIRGQCPCFLLAGRVGWIEIPVPFSLSSSSSVTLLSFLAISFPLLSLLKLQLLFKRSSILFRGKHVCSS
jgi:hypothetical protein